MANDLNIVVLVGRLTRDPELKTVGSGTSLCKFSIASNRSYTSGGEKREEVNYFNCTAWGKQAEVLAQYAKKGSQLAVNGSLRYRSWDGSDGKKQTAVDINVETFQFLSSKPKGSADSQVDDRDGYPGDFPDDDIPF